MLDMVKNKNMERLNITSTVLDKLGFTEYWDENCSSGGRTLVFKNGTHFRIMQVNETDDDSDGYDKYGKYVAEHYYFAAYFAIPELETAHDKDLFFIDDMYDCLMLNYPECTDEFYNLCDSLKMSYYLKPYASMHENKLK